MKKRLSLFVAVACTVFVCDADVTLEQCILSARENYPVIKKYELLDCTENVELSDINKGWLPRLGLYAQSTIQNVVPSFPASLSDIMEKMGGDIKGLGKLQYKIGLDLNQTIWDGGASKLQREVARQTTEVNKAALDVEMYGINSRVESLYFGILLLQSQIEQMQSSLEVYDANLARLNSMVKNGVAMQTDADMVEAQALTVRQQLASADVAVKGYRKVLSIFTGMNLEKDVLTMPQAELPANLTPERPELTLLNSQKLLNEKQREMVNVSLMPKFGLFAQTYYGYPGIDYFKSMMSRDMTFNVVGGVKVSWNIDAFYNKKNSLQKIAIADSRIDAERETFLFNNSLQSTQQVEEISGIDAIIKEDNRIIDLRRNVRLAAESQLKNGVIDATALITKINDESQASLAASLHKIQRLQAIYNLKNTLNK